MEYVMQVFFLLVWVYSICLFMACASPQPNDDVNVCTYINKTGHIKCDHQLKEAPNARR